MNILSNEVKVRRGAEVKVIMMRTAPQVGKEIIVSGEPWLVLSVTYEIPYRVRSSLDMSTREVA